MKAVLDTNVWLDWLVFDDPLAMPLRAAHAAGRIIPIASLRMRDELACVLARPAIIERIASTRARRNLACPAPDTGQSLRLFDSLVLRCEPAPDCGLRCRDPDDQAFIDLAAAQGARWLFTKDRALLALARAALARFGLLVVDPARLPDAPML